MNYEKALEIVKKVIEENKDNHVCLFIDGQWGIGKTYTFNKFREQNEGIYDVKYVSVFGKQNLKDIEKDIIMQLSSFYNIINNKVSQHPTFKLFGNVMKGIGKGTTGVELDFSKLIDNITIENIDAKDNIIICIDDLERKSNNILVKDLLGLIERTASKFKVLLIGSTINFSEDDRRAFNNFREKLIDCKLTVDELSESTLYEIMNLTLCDLDASTKKKIIEIFRKTRLKNEEALNNLRIFKQYINLIGKVYNEAIRLISNDKVNIDETIIEICNEIIYENFLVEDEGKKTNYYNLNYSRENLKKVIKEIFNYDNYDEEILKEYFEDYSEIQEDIRRFRYLYKLSRTEAEALFEKIKSKIELREEAYFIKQKYVISLYDVLSEIGIVKTVAEGLKEISEILYRPQLGNRPEEFKIEDWNNIDIYGERMNYNIISLINHINNYNISTYNAYMKKEVEEGICSNDLDRIYNVLQYIEIENFEQFEKIFELAFNKVTNEYDDYTWSILGRLICHTEDKVIENFFTDKQKEATGILEIMRLKELDSILEEKIYYEHEEEAYRQWEEENS